MISGRTVLAVVPARGGSKEVPRKNLRCVGGISLVGRAAQLATSISWIDYRILSTDDDEIMKEGKKFGLSVLFKRPVILSNDTARSSDVWRHAWLMAEQHYKKKIDLSILLEPTSPLRNKIDIKQTIIALLDGPYTCAVTVSPTPPSFTPEKTLKLDKLKKISFYKKTKKDFSLRQKISTYYHRNGICYAAKRSHFVNSRTIVKSNTIGIIISRPVVNIDSFNDLKLANYLIERKI